MDENSTKDNNTGVENDISKKAREAFKEFEQKKHGQQPEMSFSNTEIDESLKEFEQKYENEEKDKQIVKSDEISKNSKLILLVIKASGGLIKQKKQAEYVLLAITVMFFVLSGYLFYIGLGGNKQKIEPPTALELEQLRQAESGR